MKWCEDIHDYDAAKAALETGDEELIPSQLAYLSQIETGIGYQVHYVELNLQETHLVG